ncbi:hypothetical protein EDEG_03926 [Edhazardia aedis USNM 41457]|uniref:Uncharacterized protein n=1 Tax=Edhazardia aedis (strain USNM 41457) TaxID=1003232 RepID=J9DFV6_EDHAE|nr:hypothetical protein EDEG_03926 [Edhazardia aedis USNM 41457]|eukprot:EJW01485.1 hypothetical protein EDEG_03926 [Edhazardia aedis USNM 41457]
MRMCILPNEYDYSIYVMDLILTLTRKNILNAHLIPNWIKPTEHVNIKKIFDFLRNNWILSLLNYCVQNKYSTSIDKIILYIQTFANLENPFINRKIVELPFLVLLKFVLEDHKMTAEITILADIIISIQNEKFEQFKKII